MNTERAQSRFRSLSIISTVFRVLGFLVIVLGILAAIAAPFAVTVLSAQVAAVVGILLGTFIQAVLYFAFSDIINAILEIDDNTIAMRNELQQRAPVTPLRAVEGEPKPGSKPGGTNQRERRSTS